MNKRKTGYKKRFLYGVISILLVSSFLGLSVFEHSRSGFSVFSRTNSAGPGSADFDIDLLWTSDPVNGEWIDTEQEGSEVPFGSDVRWEPDLSVTRYFKIKNPGDYDFQYNLGIDIPDPEDDAESYIENHPLGNVIDVYVCNDVSDLASKEYIGTLSDCFRWPNILSKTDGNSLELESGASKTCALIFTMKHEAGNEYQGRYDVNNNKTNNISFRICAGATAEEPDPAAGKVFGVNEEELPKHNDYLYRVGNGNSIAVKQLFDIKDAPAANTGSLFAFTAFAADEIDTSLLSFEYERISGTSNVGVVYKPAQTYDSTDSFLRSSTFQFSGNGVIRVKMLYAGELKGELYLEIVSASNIFSGATSFGSGNVVMMDDIMFSSRCNFPGGKTLYGNGFSIIDGRNDTSGATGFINFTSATVDNVVISGKVYPQAVTTGTDNQYYSTGLRITGNTTIYNSYISEFKYGVSIEGGKVLMKNTTVSGGAMGNIYISAGDVTLEDCVTSKTMHGGLNGLGVVIASNNCHVTLNGTFTQYNWLNRDEIPSDYSRFLSDFYANGSAYAGTVDGVKYVNMGVLFMSDGGSFTKAIAQGLLTDNTSNSYGYEEKTPAVGMKVTVYTALASMCSSGALNCPEYKPEDNGQYYSYPSYSFDFTNKNYIPKTEGNPEFCYYDSTAEAVKISFEKADASSAFDWDPMILSLSKYGSAVPYTVTMNGTDYTGSIIHFGETGDYQVIYSYYDENQYYYDSSNGIHALTAGPYTVTLNINVTAVEPDTRVYPAKFSYTGDWAASAAKVIINNATYVMPGVGAESTYIGKTTVGGQTVYFPKVSVPATGSNGNTAYSSGKGYYFAPVFNALNIVDYDQETGSSQYTYNESSTTWPHDKAATSGPDSAYFGYDEPDGTWSATSPYGRSMGSTYYRFKRNNKGLCYTSEEIEKDNTASTHLVRYHYLSNDGTTYYFYIQYSFGAMTYSGGGTCFAEGTGITMSDGSRKPIEEIAFGESILSYNFFTGKTEGKDISLLVNHGRDNYTVLNLVFSDGTVLRTIGDHGIFDCTLNRFVYLLPENYGDYTGHKFARVDEKGRIRKVKLKDAYVTNEYTAAYSITSAQNSNAFAQGILTVAPPDDFYNWIEMGSFMRYDKKQFDADVEKYGLYDYSVFSDYVSYEEFIAFNGPYLKVAVEKGKFSFDYIIGLIKLYSVYMS